MRRDDWLTVVIAAILIAGILDMFYRWPVID